ncbi:MAG: aminodeoxychorismate/anthranilate synthase component II [Balneolaceae bacterium]|nr:aminodeoxychorismate/anthranilate synthase component II [Balneolaceae bacterium]
MILVIDNYDSFTYNLVNLVAIQGVDVRTVRNDEITTQQIDALSPKGILLSPGPGRPEDAGISEEVIRRFGPSCPIIGICLGHQAIGQVFGGDVIHAPSLMHGKVSTVRHEGDPLFTEVPNPFTATRYHSLALDTNTLPSSLQVTCSTEEGVIMGVRHAEYPLQGVQFHPESILTPDGETMLKNWIESL